MTFETPSGSPAPAAFADNALLVAAAPWPLSPAYWQVVGCRVQGAGGVGGFGRALAAQPRLLAGPSPAITSYVNPPDNFTSNVNLTDNLKYWFC